MSITTATAVAHSPVIQPCCWPLFVTKEVVLVVDHTREESGRIPAANHAAAEDGILLVIIVVVLIQQRRNHHHHQQHNRTIIKKYALMPCRRSKWPG
jgi:hypothetical protein